VTRRYLFATGLMLLVCCQGQAAESGDATQAMQEASGLTIMETVYSRHQQYPWVYEEQSMILIDQRGNKNTRKLRRYSRLTDNGSADLLLLFDSPTDVKGVALLANRSADGQMTQAFYLPAFGPQFVKADSGTSSQQQDSFLGTDYSIDNLVGEVLEDYRYERAEDFNYKEVDYFVIDAYRKDAATRPVRRHYIRQDNLFITRSDHFDELGRLRKRQTQHDLTNVHGDMWRANMMMMDNEHLSHRTVIKIDKRIFSRDYVPEEVFTEDWIVANRSLELTQDPDMPAEGSGDD